RGFTPVALYPHTDYVQADAPAPHSTPFQIYLPVSFAWNTLSTPLTVSTGLSLLSLTTKELLCCSLREDVHSMQLRRAAHRLEGKYYG
ncbi:MAG: hypothetical protein P8075_20395, partial [Deltaproteobacteria bacterium]